MVLTIIFSVLGVYIERTLILSFSGGKSVVIVRACEGRAVFLRLVDISEMSTFVLLEVQVGILPEAGDEAEIPSGGVAIGICEDECVW